MVQTIANSPEKSNPGGSGGRVIVPAAACCQTWASRANVESDWVRASLIQRKVAPSTVSIGVWSSLAARAKYLARTASGVLPSPYVGLLAAAQAAKSGKCFSRPGAKRRDQVWSRPFGPVELSSTNR